MGWPWLHLAEVTCLGAQAPASGLGLPPTSGMYLLLLRGWTRRAGHKHGAAGGSRLVLARRSERQLTPRAPWPWLLPASPPLPGAQKGPPREIGATQRAAASLRRGRQNHTPVCVTEKRHGYWLVPIVASLEPRPCKGLPAENHGEPRGRNACEFGGGRTQKEVE